MNRRHAAALALVGWYLMVPPIYKIARGQYELDRDAPLTEWINTKGFDSADDCDEGKSLNIKQTSNLLRMTFPKRGNFSTDPNWRRAFYGQCIATDDPRLKEKRPR
jgi:hypothetical protein